jgi:hypothetical protein
VLLPTILLLSIHDTDKLCPSREGCMGHPACTLYVEHGRVSCRTCAGRWTLDAGRTHTRVLRLFVTWPCLPFRDGHGWPQAPLPPLTSTESTALATVAPQSQAGKRTPLASTHRQTLTTS